MLIFSRFFHAISHRSHHHIISCSIYCVPLYQARLYLLPAPTYDDKEDKFRFETWDLRLHTNPKWRSSFHIFFKDNEEIFTTTPWRLTTDHRPPIEDRDSYEHNLTIRFSSWSWCTVEPSFLVYLWQVLGRSFEFLFYYLFGHKVSHSRFLPSIHAHIIGHSVCKRVPPERQSVFTARNMQVMKLIEEAQWKRLLLRVF